MRSACACWANASIAAALELVTPSLVCHEIGKQNPAVTSGFGELQFAILQHLDQVRAGHIEHVSRFLRGEFGMNRHYLHGVTQCQLAKNIHQ